jgi:hypothetical protein
MTVRTNARVAGFTFLLYIAVALTAMMLSGRAEAGEGTAAKLANIAQHAPDMRTSILLDFASCFCALVLAVTLWAITREVDPDLAMLGLACRMGEGLVGVASMPRSVGRLWLATAGAGAPGRAGADALGAVLFDLPSWSMELCATLFGVGSLLFAWLFLRGRMIPVALAWVGVLASILIVVVVPLQLVGSIHGPLAQLVWVPMLFFEVPLGFWLIFKGVAMPVRARAA